MTQSSSPQGAVCELCKAGIARNGKAHFCDGNFIGWCKGLPEPVAEPASTGEPPLDRTTAVEVTSEIEFMAARPPEPSGPPCPKCTKPMRQVGSKAPYTCWTCNCESSPKEVAEQSAESVTFRGRNGLDYEAELQYLIERGVVEPAAPQPVAGEGPQEFPREAAPILAALFESLIAQKCPDSVSGYAIFDAMWPKIIQYAAPEGTPKLEELQAIAEKWATDTDREIDAHAFAEFAKFILRPFITPACFYCKFYGQEHCKEHATPASTGEANGWIAKAKDLLSEMQMFKDKQGFYLRAEQLLDAAPSSVPQEGPKKSPDSHLGAVRA